MRWLGFVVALECQCTKLGSKFGFLQWNKWNSKNVVRKPHVFRKPHRQQCEPCTNVEIWSTTCRYCIILVVLLNDVNLNFDLSCNLLEFMLIFMSIGLYYKQAQIGSIVACTTLVLKRKCQFLIRRLLLFLVQYRYGTVLYCFTNNHTLPNFRMLHTGLL